MNNNVHILTDFIYNCFGNQFALFCIQKESLAGASADIHLLDSFVTEIAGYSLYSIDVYTAVSSKGGVEGNSYMFEFAHIKFGHFFLHLFDIIFQLRFASRDIISPMK